MKKYLTVCLVFVLLLLNCPQIIADNKNEATNFLEQTPSSKQLVEALKAPPRQFKFRGIKITPVQPKVLLNIAFEFNSEELTPEAKKTLTELGKALKSQLLKDNGFAIVGHTDAKGTKEYNQKLSEKRSIAVSGYLTKQHGVKSNRLKPVGKGETELLNAANPQSKTNRRVEVINMGASP